MQAWIAGVIVSVLTQLTSWLLAKGLEMIHGKELQKTTDIDIDQKLSAFKLAYKNAFNGDPLTKDDREKLKTSISDFIRNAGSGL